MKKSSTNEIIQRRKLVLPREVIATLNRPQLSRVEGGMFDDGDGGGENGTYVYPCIQTARRPAP